MLAILGLKRIGLVRINTKTYEIILVPYTCRKTIASNWIGNIFCHSGKQINRLFHSDSHCPSPFISPQNFIGEGRGIEPL
jgi:hypothetical protein